MKSVKGIFLLISILVGLGCSSKKSDPLNVAAPPAAVAVDPNTGGVADPNAGGPAGSGTGSTGSLAPSAGDVVTFVPTSFSLFNSYVGTHPLNNPKDFKLAVNLNNAGGFHYYGNIKISYVDNGQTFQGSFDVGSGVNSTYSHGLDNGILESQYNYWYNSNGKVVFSGFFQDSYGSIVLVIDSTVDQGDGQGGSYVGGSVYFKNFAQSMALQSSDRKCWFIYVGPYNCRSTDVINKSGLYPTEAEGYRKLGTFSGMSKKKAFNL